MSLPYISVVDHTIMLNFIENVLCYFESCFSRRAAFNWFVTITIGLMLRSDKLGVTSVIRDLVLNPGCYDSLLHFFRASSWSLEDIRKRWFSAVRLYAPLYKEGNYHILVGDGVKQSKEGRRMPGVKKLFQESENSAKPEYIHGHMFGGLGILAGSVRNWACIPLSIRLHDGLQAAREWKGASVSEASHVVQMVEDAYHATLTFGDSLLLLDRYFLTVPALEKMGMLYRAGITSSAPAGLVHEMTAEESFEYMEKLENALKTRMISEVLAIDLPEGINYIATPKLETEPTANIWGIPNMLPNPYPIAKHQVLAVINHNNLPAAGWCGMNNAYLTPDSYGNTLIEMNAPVLMP